MPPPTDLPSNITTVSDLVTAVNDRQRTAVAWIQQEYVSNPATVTVDLGSNQIVNLADPVNDLDAVNLRTLKKQQPTAPITQAQLALVAVPLTFGLDDDTTGENVAGKYGIIWTAGTPKVAYISVVSLPTSGDTVLDLLLSHDKGATWNSIFPAGNKAVIPGSNSGLLVTISKFSGITFAVGDLMRCDSISAGGAQGIEFVLLYQGQGLIA